MNSSWMWYVEICGDKEFWKDWFSLEKVSVLQSIYRKYSTYLCVLHFKSQISWKIMSFFVMVLRVSS